MRAVPINKSNSQGILTDDHQIYWEIFLLDILIAILRIKGCKIRYASSMKSIIMASFLYIHYCYDVF